MTGLDATRKGICASGEETDHNVSNSSDLLSRSRVLRRQAPNLPEPVVHSQRLIADQLQAGTDRRGEKMRELIWDTICGQTTLTTANGAVYGIHLSKRRPRGSP
jgi:hypothetical protein